MENRRLKRVVIKEELVELTGDFKSAIVLNQLIYWSERTKDTDNFLNEERKRIEKYGNYEFDSEKAEIIKDALTHGWIYKKASELAKDCMIGLSNATIGRILKNLIANGWIDERSNPIYKWDRTKQYRVNIAKIQYDLNKIGYALEGYSLGTACNNSFQNENSSFNHEKSNFQNEKLQIQNEKSQFQNEKAIPEITTEIKNTETIYKDSTTQFLACSDIKKNAKTFNQVEIVEDNTHLILSKNQRSKVLLWDVIRLKKSIEIFKEQQGQYFALLEKIYLDNKNFVPKSNKSNTNSKVNPATFTQREYDYDKLELQLLGWETPVEETEESIPDTEVVEAETESNTNLFIFLEDKIAEVALKTWIMPNFRVTAKEIILTTTDTFIKNIIAKRYLEFIQDFASKTGKTVVMG